MVLMTGMMGGMPAFSQEEAGMVNINTADQAALMTLSGIGEAKAQAIITYRQEKGLFKTIEDLKKVSGVGDKTFESIKTKITVGEGGA